QFSLRPRVLALGYAYLSSFSVAQIAQPHLEDLAEKLHESCSVSVLDGDDLVYVARASANRIMTISLTVGTRLPPYPTSMGRVLLAHMTEAELDAHLSRTELRKLTDHTIVDPAELRAVLATVRRQGWAAVDQELEAGVRSIAVPIRDGSRKVVAAINASAHAARVPMRTLEKQFLPRLVDSARQIDDRMVDVPRLLCFYGEGEPLPDPALAEARDALNVHYGPGLGEPLCTAGLCLYRDGRDSVAWHGDTTGRGRTQDTVVAIVS